MRRIRLAAAHISLALFVASAAACSPSPTPSPTVASAGAPTASASAAPSAPPPAPARWELPAGNALGPALDGARYFVHRGRVARVDAQGLVEVSAHAPPNPIHRLFAAMSAAGAFVLIGTTRHGTIERFDDPLGAPRRLAELPGATDTVSGPPGFLLVPEHRGARSMPARVSISDGTIADAPSTDLPMLTAAFVDARHGAAVFAGAGLHATRDGGRSWTSVVRPVNPPQQDLGPLELDADSRGIRASNGFDIEDELEAMVDPETATLGATHRAGVETHPALLWASTGADPLQAALMGVPISPGEVLAATKGILARIDASSGAVLEARTLVDGAPERDCHLARAGKQVLVACPAHPGTQPGPWELSTIDAPEARPLAMARRLRFAHGPLVAGTAGGVRTPGGCAGGSSYETCVRQPDGSWASIRLSQDEASAGPLADGRVVVLRRAAVGPGMQVMALDPGGGATPFGPALDFIDAWVVGGIDEWSNGDLHLLVGEAAGITAVVVPKDAGARAGRAALPGAVFGALHGLHGLVMGADGARATTDGGVSWSPVAAPPSLLDAARRISGMDSKPQDRPLLPLLLGFHVGELGAVTHGQLALLPGSWMRLGWSGDSPLPTVPERTPWADDRSRRSPSNGSRHLGLECRSIEQSPARSPRSYAEFVELVRRGDPRGVEYKTFHNDGMAVELAVLSESPGHAGVARRRRWRLRWTDAMAVGAGLREWSGPEPAGARSQISDLYMGTNGSRVVISIRTYGKPRDALPRPGESTTFLVRPHDVARADTAAIDGFAGPFVHIEVGNDGGAAWSSYRPVVWAAGDVPRLLPSADATRMILGAPRQGTVPIMIGADDWARRADVSIAGLPAVPEHFDKVLTQRVPLAGWSSSAVLEPRAAKTCQKPRTGPRVLAAFPDPQVQLDGQTIAAVHDSVELSAEDGCISRITTQVPAQHVGGRASDVRATVRISFPGGRGHILTANDTTVRRVACSLRPGR